MHDGLSAHSAEHVGQPQTHLKTLKHAFLWRHLTSASGPNPQATLCDSSGKWGRRTEAAPRRPETPRESPLRRKCRAWPPSSDPRWHLLTELAASSLFSPLLILYLHYFVRPAFGLVSLDPMLPLMFSGAVGHASTPAAFAQGRPVGAASGAFLDHIRFFISYEDLAPLRARHVGRVVGAHVAGHQLGSGPKILLEGNGMFK